MIGIDSINVPNHFGNPRPVHWWRYHDRSNTSLHTTTLIINKLKRSSYVSVVNQIKSNQTGDMFEVQDEFTLQGSLIAINAIVIWCHFLPFTSVFAVNSVAAYLGGEPTMV